MRKIAHYLIIIITALIVLSGCSVNESIKKEILSFTFQNCPASVIYDFDNNVYRVVISNQNDITNLIPIIEVSEGASVSPPSGHPVDFTNEVTFTVTAEDGSSRNYQVIVNIEENKALLLVDVQTDYFPVYNQEIFLDNLNILIDRAGEKNAPIFFIHQTDENTTEGSPGWQFHNQIIRPGSEIVVTKRYRDGFLGTTLMEELDQRKIGTVVITGLQTDFCVESTCRGGAGLAYNIIIPSDAHTVLVSSITGIPHEVIADFNERMEQEEIGIVIPTEDVEF